MLHMLAHACYPRTQEGDRRSPKPAGTEQVLSEKKLVGPYLRRIEKERKQHNREIYLTNN